jgi:hypothetical protein
VITYIGNLTEQHLLKEEEAEIWVHEVEEELEAVNKCYRLHGSRMSKCASDMSGLLYTSNHGTSLTHLEAIGDDR